MELIADVLLAAGAFGAAAYCLVLQRRITRFTQLESGMGSAIAVLSAQVDDLTRALTAAQATASQSTQRLEDLTRRADSAAMRLELLVSSLHDLPEPEDRGADPGAERRMRFVRARSRREPEAAE
jgi:outer membrane murein-binding lipoprotein Lpp